METYVLKCKDKYCRFGSYSTVSLVDSPTMAMLYSNCKIAQKRLKRSSYLDRNDIRSELFLVQLELDIVKETIVKDNL